MAKRKEMKLKFAGFPEDYIKTFWKYPRMLEGYWFMLSGSEQKILDFILRQTIGYGKKSDKISLSQFQKGIGERNKGIGLVKTTIVESIKGLVDKRFIWVKKVNSRTNEYGLVVQDLNKGVVHKLDKTGSNLGRGGSNLEQGSGSKTEHTVDNSNRDFTKEEYIEKLYSFYRVRVCPVARLTKEGRSRIAERLEEYSPDELAEAIGRFSKDDWNMEKNSHRGAAWFFATEDRIDSFRNLKSSEGKEELRRDTYNQEEDRIE